MVWVFRLDADRSFSSGVPVSSSDVAASIERVRALGSAVLASTGLSSIETYDTTDPRTLVIRLVVAVRGAARAAGRPDLRGGAGRGGRGDDERGRDAGGERAVRSRRGERGVAGCWPVAPRPSGSGVDLMALRRFGSSDRCVRRPGRRRGGGGGRAPTAGKRECRARSGWSRPTGPSQVFFGLDLRSPELADVRVREAVVRAVDSSAVVDTALPGAATAVTSLGTPLQCVAPCGADVARASALVSELAAERGGSVPLTIDTFGPGSEGSDPIGADSTRVRWPTRWRINFGPSGSSSRWSSTIRPNTPPPWGRAH